MSVFLKDGTITMSNPPSLIAFAAAAGRMEGEGPLGSCFDYVSEDSTFGENTWEKAESRLQQHALEQALTKGGISEGDISFIFAGDLLNQCTGSAYSIRDTGARFIGLYGACSTMAESLSMASVFIDNGVGSINVALTSSHFCSAERQFRFPLEYGSQRTPASQWTVTGAGSAVVRNAGRGVRIQQVCFGQVGIRNLTSSAFLSTIDNISTELSPLS